nr:hypothetical protein [Maliibacterium massiliense]
MHFYGKTRTFHRKKANFYTIVRYFYSRRVRARRPARGVRRFARVAFLQVAASPPAVCFDGWLLRLRILQAAPAFASGVWIGAIPFAGAVFVAALRAHVRHAPKGHVPPCFLPPSQHA